MDLDTFSPDILIAGDQQVQTKEVVVDTGDLARGAVLGKIKAGAVPTTGTAGGGNSGAATVTGVVGKRRVKVGTYAAVCISAVASGGTFQVTDPEGKHIGIAEVGTLFSSDQIEFTINDAGGDPVVGDSYTVVVPAGSGKYVIVNKANVDGSGVADCILSEAVDATSADKTTIGYKTGQFNRAALTFGSTDTYADHEADLRVNDINLVDVMA